jgi:hypothetical protein
MKTEALTKKKTLTSLKSLPDFYSSHHNQTTKNKRLSLHGMLQEREIDEICGENTRSTID